MGTFVVLTGSEKHEILDPPVIGPFEGPEEAVKWVTELPNATVLTESPFEGYLVLRPTLGGYAGFVLVDEEHASSPELYLAEEEEVYAE